MLKFKHRPGCLDREFTFPLYFSACSVFQVCGSAMNLEHVVARQRARLLCVSRKVRSPAAQRHPINVVFRWMEREDQAIDVVSVRSTNSESISSGSWMARALRRHSG